MVAPRRATILWLALALLAPVARAQLIAPQNPDEEKQFAAVQAASAKAGIDGGVSWHGEGRWAHLWLVIAPTEGSEKLALVVEKRHAAPAVVALGEVAPGMVMPSVEPLFARPEVIDVVVLQRPMQLETTRTVVTHDLVALGARPARLCHIDGTTSSSGGMGPDSTSDSRQVDVTVDHAAHAPTIVVTRRDVKVVRHHDGTQQRTESPARVERLTVDAKGCTPETPAR